VKVKFSFATDAIMLLPMVFVFRCKRGWQIGIGWLCWGLLFERGDR
jgi:hypothetical protein